MDKFVTTGPAKKKQKISETETKEIAQDSSKTETTSSKASSENESVVDNGIVANLTDPQWKKELEGEFKAAYFKKIIEFLEGEKKKKIQVFPPEQDVFSAFNLTTFDNVRCVIIGQDPYHDNGQAHGLCFSVRKGVAVPPSLKNIYKELSTDITGWKTPTHGNLEHWAKGGVLLLNATLTVEAHKANSHQAIGWQTFTDNVIKIINRNKKNVVFLLWGGFAKQRSKYIDKVKHCVLEAAHPSPLGQGKFFGSKHFSKTNAYLKEHGLPEIDWTVPQ